jgi:hypothetical protein
MGKQVKNLVYLLIFSCCSNVYEKRPNWPFSSLGYAWYKKSSCLAEFINIQSEECKTPAAGITK